MPRKDVTATVGLCASLLMHGAFVFTLLLFYIRDIDRGGLRLPGYALGGASEASPLVLPDPPEPIAPPPTVELPKPPEPPPAKPIPKPKPKPPDFVKRDSQFGSATGKGTALNDSPGDEPMQARDASQDQAWLSRDPVGPGPLPLEPSPSTVLPGDNGNAGRPGAPGKPAPRKPLVTLPESVAAPFGPHQPAPLPIQPALVAKAPAPPPPVAVLPAPPPPPAEVPKSNLIAIGQNTSKSPTTGPATGPATGPSVSSPQIAKGSPTTRPTTQYAKLPTTRPVESAATKPPTTRPTQLASKTPPTTQPVDPKSSTTRPVPQFAKVSTTQESPPAKAPTTQPQLAKVPTTQPAPVAKIPTTQPAPVAKVPTTQPLLAKAPTTVPTTQYAQKDPSRPAPPPEPQAPSAGNNGGGGTGRPGPAIPAADSAPMTDSESDAFAKAGAFRFRNGKLAARFGRGFKSVKPRIELKGWLDADSLPDPSVTMRVSIDEAGKVTDVRIIKSSGSDSLDLPTTVAMYKWWIEPAKNKAGKAVPDVMVITFSFL